MGLDEYYWLHDALSAREIAARAVVDHVIHKCAHTLVVNGASTFTLALLAELTERQRECSARLVPMAGELPVVYLVGAQAAAAEEQFLRHQRRFGHDGCPEWLRARADVTFKEATDQLLTSPGAVLILTGEDSGLAGASSFAAERPDWHVIAWDSGARGFSPSPVMGGLRLAGPTLTPVPGRPLDVWEWFGRLTHDRYLDRYYGGEPVPGHDRKGDWDEDLSPETKATNVRVVARTLAGAVALDRSWTAADRPGQHSVPPAHAFDENERQWLAIYEHDSWRAYMRALGWRHAPWTAERLAGLGVLIPAFLRKRHYALLDWEHLPEDGRIGAHNSVTDALELLGTLGYRLRVADGEEVGCAQSTWQAFERFGIVTAERLKSAVTWRTAAGDELTGHQGDWLVSDQNGAQRTVAPDAFAATYRGLDNGSYERVGRTLARRVSSPERVATAEGMAFAECGDYVVLGSLGEQWPVPANEFTAGYRIASETGNVKVGTVGPLSEGASQ